MTNRVLIKLTTNQTELLILPLYETPPCAFHVDVFMRHVDIPGMVFTLTNKDIMLQILNDNSNSIYNSF